MTDFTVADVLAWARTKPADETYCYIDAGNCAICQFLRETERAKTPRVVPNSWRDGVLSDDRHTYDERIDGSAKPVEGFNSTFGEFVKRLERMAETTEIGSGSADQPGPEGMRHTGSPQSESN